MKIWSALPSRNYDPSKRSEGIALHEKLLVQEGDAFPWRRLRHRLQECEHVRQFLVRYRPLGIGWHFAARRTYITDESRKRDLRRADPCSGYSRALTMT